MSQSQFVKLYSSILESSIWFEKPEIKIVWITLLLSADVNGNVYSTIPGIANKAAVTPEDVEEALAVFTSVDKFSRTKDSEGRRIEQIDGGWKLLNYKKYRETRDVESRRDYMRKYMRDYRKEDQPVNFVNSCKPQLAHVEGEVEEEYSSVGSTIKGPVVCKQSNKPTTQSLETKKEEAKQETNKFRNAPTLAEATNYFDRAKSNFSRQEVKRCWQSFEATAVDGIWMWGRRPVTDWRHAMECRINDSRDKNPNQNTAKNTTEAAIKAIRAIRP